MGQRHQLYFVLPAVKDTPSRRVVGLHHQWLYGSAPLRTLQRVLDAVAKQGTSEFAWWAQTYIVDENLPEYVAHHALMAITGLEPDGDFTTLYPLLGGETTDPRTGDNNDGITIVDMRNPAKVKFAFARFNLPRNFDWRNEPLERWAEATKVTILTPSQYLARYYERDATNNDHGKVAPDGSWQLADALDALPQLSRAEVRKLFPAMFRKLKASAA